MTDTPPSQPPGWYYAQGDPPGTQRFWDGAQWQGGPQPVGGQGVAVGGAPSLASPWARLGARILDFLILIIPIGIVSAALGGGGLYGSGSFGFSFKAFVGTLITTAIALGYEFYFLNKDGATIGKKALNIKVVKADGSPIDQDGVLRRLVLSALQVVPFLGGLIGLVVGLATIVMIFVDDRRQTPADKLADSIVVTT